MGKNVLKKHYKEQQYAWSVKEVEWEGKNLKIWKDKKIIHEKFYSYLELPEATPKTIAEIIRNKEFGKSKKSS